MFKSMRKKNNMVNIDEDEMEEGCRLTLEMMKYKPNRLERN